MEEQVSAVSSLSQLFPDKTNNNKEKKSLYKDLFHDIEKK